MPELDTLPPAVVAGELATLPAAAAEDDATMSGKVKRSWVWPPLPWGALQGDLQTEAELGGVGTPWLPADEWCRDLDPGDLGLRLQTDVWEEEAVRDGPATRLDERFRLLLLLNPPPPPGRPGEETALRAPGLCRRMDTPEMVRLGLRANSFWTLGPSSESSSFSSSAIELFWILMVRQGGFFFRLDFFFWLPPWPDGNA